MKNLSVFMVCVLAIACSGNVTYPERDNTQTTTLFIVRHAEKANDGTDDPPLNTEGQQRASALARALEDASIGKIYATPYRRNLETAAVLAENRGLAVEKYDPGNEEFLKSAVATNPGENILIIGHSNTVPGMVNQLIGQRRFDNLRDDEYDFLFMVQLGNDTTLTVLHYGKVPGTTGNDGAN